MERQRSILITYQVKIDRVAFAALSIHQVDESEDIFVFANELLISKGLEKMFNTYFIAEGLAEVKIKEVQVIDEKMFKLLSDLLK